MKALSVLDQSAHFLTRPHSSVPTAPIGGGFAWTAADVPDPLGSADQLTAAEITAIEALLAHAEAAGVAENDIGPGDWTCPELDALAARWSARLDRGPGFVLARGVPVGVWPLVRAKLFMAVLGAAFGRLGLQNPRGDVIGEVRKVAGSGDRAGARNYITDREFRPHCDAADLLGLLCIRPAARGGQSRLTSSVAVFDALLSARPDVARRLFEPVLLDLMDEQPDGVPPAVPIVPAAHDAGRLSTFYIADYYRSPGRHPGFEVSPQSRELFDLYEALAEDPALELRFDLAPGDLMLVNNHVMLHARDAFEDAPGAERLMLRFLVSRPR
jgi:hypothetical protein